MTTRISVLNEVSEETAVVWNDSIYEIDEKRPRDNKAMVTTATWQFAT
jgi:hypothetical protein